MDATLVVPIVTLVVGGAVLAGCVLRLDEHPRAWLVPAALSAVFAAFSLVAVVREGPLGFWPEHVRNLWGNQIFADLVLAATMAVGLSAREARASFGCRARLVPWILLILATGSIGLCAYASRLMYLRSLGGGARGHAA